MENNFEDEKTLQPQTQTRYSNNANKKFSILPDLATGWRPKSLVIPPPILIKYKENYIQYLINNQPKFNYNIIYLGPRHYNSFSFHNQVLHEYHVRFVLNNQQLSENFQHQIEKYKLIDNREFVGMNPKLKNKCKIQFDSNFESGNLDLVIQKQQNQFDLFLRPDSNTCGHTQWFYFKINIKKNFIQNQSKAIKMNICNNKKFKTLYCKGMKPYVLSKKIQQSQNIGWHQSGKNVVYKKYKNPYVHQSVPQGQSLQKSEINQPIKYLPEQQPNKQSHQQQTNQFKNDQNYYCLSFEYQVQFDEDEIYFAYCPPYTYSQLRKQISCLKRKASNQENVFIHQQKLCISLSGVEVPLLTITDSSIQDEGKKIIFSTARIHPGQSNGSYVMEGFLHFLTSPQAQSLRKTCIFKIVPMINPDGVIIGNFRTGLCGKDLNRQFKVKNLQLLPQIASLKQYIRKLKFQKGSSLLYYLDFHGHSTKKNVFVYGPQYDIWDLRFQRSKILPKLISCKTNMFKLNSCLYKVANYKKATSRAFMLGHIPFCYTVESSIGIYKQKNGQNCNFTVQKWRQMGQSIGEVFEKCLQKLKQQTFNLVRKQKKKKKSIFTKNNNTEAALIQSLPLNNQNETTLGVYQNSLSLIDTQDGKKEKKEDNNRQMLKSMSLQSIQNSKKFLEPIHHIRRRQKQVTLLFPKIKQQKNESDQELQSDGKSDCQSESNDFTKNQYELLSKDILKVIQDFKKVVESQNNIKKYFSIDKKTNLSVDKKKFKKKGGQTSNIKNILLKGIVEKNGKIHKKDIIQMKMVPSLKHKLININNLNFNNQKNSLNNFEKSNFMTGAQKNNLTNSQKPTVQRNLQRSRHNLSQPKITRRQSFNFKNHHPSLMVSRPI